MLSCKTSLVILAQPVVLGLTLVCLAGCGGGEGQRPADEPAAGGDRKDLEAELRSLHGYLSVADLKKFRPGRSKSDVLEDIQWRAGGVNAAECDGKRVMVIDYSLLVDPADRYKSTDFHAIFIDGKFEKFIQWDTGVEDRPEKVGECKRLSRLLSIPPVSADDLQGTAESATAPPKQVDVGLTIAWLLLRPRFKFRDATVDDFKRNAALRDQFNAARLDIGMTEQDVERVLKAKPLESGELEAGTCKVYGSNESLPVGDLHYSNVVVVCRQGKVIAISNFPGGEWGRNEAPKGVIDRLKRDDAAAGAPGDKKNPRK